ncbi:hypothetical protein QSV34_14395 [Porticoccus sp. W117]|uniref:hypothetical protein n=1 Tax=Porticoccus sp. W117 TaxID=3054777 RepID=UPI002596B59A|nr:hypothetical protein [Porticoccus sp. W117]MDM3872539.1 hypothetical protein [Porticoccus sp. W117]
MASETWADNQTTQLVAWCDELAELQALEAFLAAALADAEDRHCNNASLLADQLQRRLCCLREQIYASLCSLRAQQ